MSTGWLLILSELVALFEPLDSLTSFQSCLVDEGVTLDKTEVRWSSMSLPIFAVSSLASGILPLRISLLRLRSKRRVSGLLQ